MAVKMAQWDLNHLMFPAVLKYTTLYFHETQFLVH